MEVTDLVTLVKFKELSGYTPKAVTRKIEDGVFLEGYEVVKAPDRKWLVSIEGYERWAASLPRVALSQRVTASKCDSHGEAKTSGQRSRSSQPLPT
jgi:hypothetical protein